MKIRKCFAAGAFLLAGALALGTIAVAESQNGGTAAPAMKLPKGWTQEDVQKCMVAGTPGKMHELLAMNVGEWHGKSTMWMGDGGDAENTEVTSSYAALMDGHYFKCDWTGDMGGMPYHGSGLYGYDNVSKQFEVTWIDNHSTGIMHGTGELSADGKSVTWKINFNCPLTGKPDVMREIESMGDASKKTIVMYGPDPKTGKEYKMMSVELTKK